MYLLVANMLAGEGDCECDIGGAICKESIDPFGVPTLSGDAPGDATCYPLGE